MHKLQYVPVVLYRAEAMHSPSTYRLTRKTKCGSFSIINLTTNESLLSKIPKFIRYLEGGPPRPTRTPPPLLEKPWGAKLGNKGITPLLRQSPCLSGCEYNVTRDLYDGTYTLPILRNSYDGHLRSYKLWNAMTMVYQPPTQRLCLLLRKIVSKTLTRLVTPVLAVIMVGS